MRCAVLRVDCLHLGCLQHLLVEMQVFAIALEGQQHRRLPHAAHTNQADRHSLVRPRPQANADFAGRRPPAGVAADRFAHYAHVFGEKQITRIGGHGTLRDAGGGNEGGVGEQEASVAVHHGEAERQLTEQVRDIIESDAAFLRAAILIKQQQ